VFFLNIFIVASKRNVTVLATAYDGKGGGHGRIALPLDPPVYQTRDVHGNGIPRGNGNPMRFLWEWEFKADFHGNGNGNGNDFRGSGMLENAL